MTDLSWIALAASFVVIALVYSSVGFGGGSSYTAMLALAGVTTAWIPVLSLGCNLIVVCGGCRHFARRGHLSTALVGPFLLTSVPAAYVAGRIPVPPDLYLSALAGTLFAVTILLWFRPRAADSQIRPCPVPVRLLTGGLLGGVSGLVGIGGGIFLAPVLLLARWATPKQSAAAASLFILVNSLAGLLGQLAKPDAIFALARLPVLAVAVFLGGQIGSRLGSGLLSMSVIRQTTAALIGLVAVRLCLQQI
jgi:hypothetical protein